MSARDDELACDVPGRCEALPGARGVTNCVHCGKELVERDGQWWTWDADMFPDPQPQGPIT